MKPFISTYFYNHADQKLIIQPTPEMDGIEIYIQEIDGSKSSGAFYISQEELPYLTQKLNEMMNYLK